jgi:hypothetical protein
MYLIEVTSHPLATADLHILDPRNPLPPQTTRRFVVAVAIGPACAVEAQRRRVLSGRNQKSADELLNPFNLLYFDQSIESSYPLEIQLVEC